MMRRLLPLLLLLLLLSLPALAGGLGALLKAASHADDVGRAGIKAASHADDAARAGKAASHVDDGARAGGHVDDGAAAVGAAEDGRHADEAAKHEGVDVGTAVDAAGLAADAAGSASDGDAKKADNVDKESWASMSEINKHGARLGTLQELRRVADETQDRPLAEQVTRIFNKETARHEKAMASIRLKELRGKR